MTEIKRAGIVAAAITWLLLVTVAAMAQEASEDGWVHGPANVQLGRVASVDLPAGYLFADAEMTTQIMETLGNPPSGLEAGLITSADEDHSWFVVFEHNPVGYVSDGDGDDIDANALLDSIREATEAANEQRQQMGGGQLHVTGWSEAPHYDQTSHNLVWALEAADESDDRVVNYNVRLLGRSGYMSVTLVTDPEKLATDKPEIETVLASFSYDDGQRYADFVDGDKLAGYGLAALVAGGAGAAAAKLGLFAVLGKFLAKGWKLIVAFVIFLGALLKRIFGGGQARGAEAG